MLDAWCMLDGSRLMAHAPRFVAQGPWLMAKKNLALGLPGPSPSADFFLAMCLEPQALRHEPRAVNYGPLTINNRLIDELFDYILWVSSIIQQSSFLHFLIPSFRSVKVSKIPDFKISKFKSSKFQKFKKQTLHSSRISKYWVVSSRKETWNITVHTFCNNSSS